MLIEMIEVVINHLTIKLQYGFVVRKYQACTVIVPTFFLPGVEAYRF